MQQYIFVGITLLSHYGSSDLAQAHAMPPACATKNKPLGKTVAFTFFFHDKSGTVKVGRRKGPTDFQFLADDASFFRPYDFQSVDASGGTSRERNQIYDISIVHAGAPVNQFRQFGLAVLHLPAVKISGFPVIVIQNLRQNFGSWVLQKASGDDNIHFRAFSSFVKSGKSIGFSLSRRASR